MPSVRVFLAIHDELFRNVHVLNAAKTLSKTDRNLGVFILTDSYLRNAELSYTVEAGDTIWAILMRFRAGPAPAQFGNVANEIARSNGLESPDRVRAGQRLRLRWPGIGMSAPERGQWSDFERFIGKQISPSRDRPVSRPQVLLATRRERKDIWSM